MDNSNQAKRDRREWTIMNLFSSCYSMFPLGVITKSECPDFILKTEKKRIGIELTELKYERNDTQFNMRAHEDFLSAIMHSAQEIFEQQSDLRLVVDVHFSEGIGPSTLIEQGVAEGMLIKQGLSESISKIVIDNLPESTGKKYVVDRNSKYGDLNLPLMIEAINIVNVTGRMDESLWFASISTKVKPISVESISQRIKNKDKKLLKYDQNCDEQWLIIIQNSFLMSSTYDPVAAERALRHRYRSHFDKVFVFERSEGRVTPINVSNY